MTQRTRNEVVRQLMSFDPKVIKKFADAYDNDPRHCETDCPNYDELYEAIASTYFTDYNKDENEITSSAFWGKIAREEGLDPLLIRFAEIVDETGF